MHFELPSKTSLNEQNDSVHAALIQSVCSEKNCSKTTAEQATGIPKLQLAGMFDAKSSTDNPEQLKQQIIDLQRELQAKDQQLRQAQTERDRALQDANRNQQDLSRAQSDARKAEADARRAEDAARNCRR